MEKILNNRNTERGTGMIEYVLLLGLISLIGISSISKFGEAISGKYTYISNAIENAGNTNGGDGSDGGSIPTPPLPTGPIRPNH